MKGGIRLFRLFGIDVHLHWTWFIVAYFIVQLRLDRYGSPLWAVAEYVTLFGIVLLHEFGHALACRSVGGTAHRIMLWPLGGVAFVSPPHRPGALLWSIAAGPLVNVLLVPVSIGLVLVVGALAPGSEDLAGFVLALAVINLIILIFNMLPVYPLDGGQILHALLWFIMGPARSLLVAAVVGLIGSAGLFLLALAAGEWLLIAIAVFIGFQAYGGFSRARQMHRMVHGPRREGLACPYCNVEPPVGAYWLCDQCNQAFDAFEQQAICPHCGKPAGAIPCVHCGNVSHVPVLE